MDQSIQYNLRNPAFTEDIGYSCINQMYPTICDVPPTMVPAMPGAQINPGQPNKDTFKPTKAEKERNFISKALLLGLVTLGGFLIYKKSGNLARKIINISQNAGTKIVNSGKNLGNKIKNIFR